MKILFLLIVLSGCGGDEADGKDQGFVPESLIQKLLKQTKQSDQ